MLRDRFLNAMSEAAATVSVVATDRPAGRAGVTVSAMCSVSADPPMLLVCVHHLSRSCAAIRDNGRFSINLLGAGQADISDVFAGRVPAPGGDKFACARWRELATGAPALDQALVTLDCWLVEHTRQGAHTIFIGKVADVVLGRGAPLLYARRAYRNLGLPVDAFAATA